MHAGRVWRNVPGSAHLEGEGTVRTVIPRALPARPSRRAGRRCLSAGAVVSMNRRPFRRRRGNPESSARRNGADARASRSNPLMCRPRARPANQACSAGSIRRASPQCDRRPGDWPRFGHDRNDGKRFHIVAECGRQALRFLPLGMHSRTVGDFSAIREFMAKARVNVRPTWSM